MTLTQKEIQDCILAFIKVHPQRTHAEVHSSLPWLGSLHEVAMNMNALAANNQLVFERTNWDGRSNNKRYSLQ